MLLTRRAALTRIAVGSAFAGTALSAQQRPLAETPEQNVGPFYPMRRPADADADLTMIRGRDGRATGEVIEVTGRVLNLQGAPVGGVSLELWQANAVGRYAHPGDTNEAAPLDPNFQGFARLTTDRQGRYRFVTIKPGAYPIGGGQSRTRHIHVDAAGQINRLTTQMYFPGDPLNGADMLLRQLNPAAAAAVTARTDGVAADGRPRFVWDIVLQAG